MVRGARRARSPSGYWSAESPQRVWRRARGTWDCRCEHEPQIRLTARSSPVGQPQRQPSEEEDMEQIHDRVAGLDADRDEVTVCVRMLGPRGGVRAEKSRFKTTTGGLAVLAAGLARRNARSPWPRCRRPAGTGNPFTTRSRTVSSCGCATRITSGTSRAARPICPMWSGWPTWPRTGWCVPASCRRCRSGNCGKLTRYRRKQTDVRASGDRAAGEGPAGCRDQAHLRRLEGTDPVRAGDGRSADRRGTRPGGRWPSWPKASCGRRSRS